MKGEQVDEEPTISEALLPICVDVVFDKEWRHKYSIDKIDNTKC